MTPMARYFPAENKLMQRLRARLPWLRAGESNALTCKFSGARWWFDPLRAIWRRQR